MNKVGTFWLRDKAAKLEAELAGFVAREKDHPPCFLSVSLEHSLAALRFAVGLTSPPE